MDRPTTRLLEVLRAAKTQDLRKILSEEKNSMAVTQHSWPGSKSCLSVSLEDLVGPTVRRPAAPGPKERDFSPLFAWRVKTIHKGGNVSAPIDGSLDVSFDLTASEGQFCELFGQMCIKCEILKRKMWVFFFKLLLSNFDVINVPEYNTVPI